MEEYKKSYIDVRIDPDNPQDVLKHYLYHLNEKKFITIHNKFIIGRKAPHLELDDDRLSREHCKLYINHKQELFLKDLDSKNGTKLNNVKLNSNKLYKLSQNDMVEIGDHSFQYSTIDEVSFIENYKPGQLLTREMVLNLPLVLFIKSKLIPEFIIALTLFWIFILINIFNTGPQHVTKGMMEAGVQSYTFLKIILILLQGIITSSTFFFATKTIRSLSIPTKRKQIIITTFGISIAVYLIAFLISLFVISAHSYENFAEIKKVKVIEQGHFSKETAFTKSQNVDAVIGNSFGLLIYIQGNPVGKKVKMTLTITYPKQGLISPKYGRILRQQDFTQMIPIGKKYKVGMTFTEQFQLQEGIWTLELKTKDISYGKALFEINLPTSKADKSK